MKTRVGMELEELVVRVQSEPVSEFNMAECEKTYALATVIGTECGMSGIAVRNLISALVGVDGLNPNGDSDDVQRVLALYGKQLEVEL